MLTMQPTSDVLPRTHRLSASNPWSPTMQDFSESDYTYPGRTSPIELKARPSADVFQNGIRYNDGRGLSLVSNGPRPAIDHDDLLAPSRSDSLSNSSSPPSEHSDVAQQLLEAQSAASTSPRSAQSSSDKRSSQAASSPPTSASAGESQPITSSWIPKPLLPELLDGDFQSDATPIKLRSGGNDPNFPAEGLHRHHSSLTSPLSPLVEPFSPNVGSGPMPAVSVAPSLTNFNGPADLSAKRSSASLTSLASMTSIPDLRAQNFDSRAPSSTGSVSSGVTVHSLYAHPYGEPNGLPAELTSPNSLTSATFASLGAQLALNDRLAALPKSQQIESSGSANGTEEISTIFVVGFPEDMHEREFQNMFIFSPGFEAATLKTPNNPPPSNTSSSSRDSANKMNIAAALEGYGMPFGNFDLEDGGYGPNGNSLASVLGSRDGKDTNQQRKQIIGFAKFRTRQEALDAVAVLSGRRVDADKDCVLKAEMAKKNLHTRRGLANDTSTGAGQAVGVGNAAGNNSLPPSVLALGQHNLAVAAALSPQVIANALAQQQVQRDPTTVAVLLREQEMQREARAQQQHNAAFDAFHSVPATQASFANHRQSVDSGSAVAQADPRYNSYASREHRDSVASNSSTAPYYRSGSVSGRDAYGKSLLQQLETDTPYSASGPSSAIGQTSDGYTRHAFYSSSSGHDEHTSQTYGGLGSVHAAPSGLGSRLQGLSLNTGLSNSMRSTSPITPGLTSPRGTNPADMNPPINTLYVGGLPAVLPSLTGPMSASHLEDSLRAVFSRSPGFKRLCFRQKSNGPMSFVEYEGVEYATRALHDLYGHTLGGLVKGGIRLSYSKNPLGVRSGSVSTPTGSHTPLSPTSNNFASFLNGPDSFLSNGNTPTPNANASRRLGHDVPQSSYQQLYRSTTPRSAASPPPASPSHLSSFSPFSEMGRGIF